MKRAIIVDPRIKYNYASWYLLGLQRIIGKHQITFVVNPFKELLYTNIKQLNAGMSFILKEQGKERKFFVDFEDNANIFEDRYIYGAMYMKK